MRRPSVMEVLGLAGIVAAAVLISVRPSKEPPLPEPEASPSAPAPRADVAPAGFSARPAVFSEEALREIRDCLGGDPGAGSPEELLDWAAANLGPERFRREHSRNAHLVLPGGERRRLRVFDADRGESRPRRELQWFSEDAEGLPVLIRIPKEDSRDPGDETIARYLAQGRVVFEERASTLEWAKGSAELTRKNARIEELHLRAAGGVSLGCAAPPDSGGFACRCLSRR